MVLNGWARIGAVASVLYIVVFTSYGFYKFVRSPDYSDERSKSHLVSYRFGTSTFTSDFQNAKPPLSYTLAAAVNKQKCLVGRGQAKPQLENKEPKSIFEQLPSEECKGWAYPKAFNYQNFWLTLSIPPLSLWLLSFLLLVIVRWIKDGFKDT